MTDDWGALAKAVRARRESLRMAQADLATHGGPGEATVRRIERGEVSSVRAGTKSQLEAALRWHPGTVDRVLDGTATDEVTQTRRSAEAALSYALAQEAELGVTATGRPVLAAYERTSAALRDLVSVEDRTPDLDRATELLREAVALLIREI
ncbi:hypothetical protein [Pseudonocardia sp. WMMC193]|uniref:hypothetical protein n=1 Tax=Pseudonocardia sp. WMMC193 TaxID=2911965 RepID=UPI001F1DF4A0|nr:hypothetical protein [Pseudonocardia sp. WMMC193]MCF7550487.1 hypothetical protein [Pseudonocardia sp. WMMC193]